MTNIGASTYNFIASQTLGSSASSVTFNSIPQTYTDLVIVLSVGNTDKSIGMRFNSDSGTNYSRTFMYGNGTSAVSARTSNDTGIFPPVGQSSTNFGSPIIHINNYSNSTTYKTVLIRGNDGADATWDIVSLWRATPAPITSINFYLVGSAQMLAGSTFTLYGIQAAAVSKAYGGTITTDSTYTYHTFTSSGLFTPLATITADILVVAGGGGGGGNDGGGGGGAGGLRSTVTATGGGGSLESSLTLSPSTSYTITVGSGGAAGVGYGVRGTNGVNSSIIGGSISITSLGGGGGGSYNNNGLTGGSGGGGAMFAGLTGGSGTSNQGYAGGNGGNNAAATSAGGGGGGAGSIGANYSSNYGGNGGNGVTITALATPTGTGVSGAYAGGGGGGGGDNVYTSVGGTGAAGGGNGGNYPNSGTNATSNTGSGGGGGAYGGGNGGAGGSGVVIVRYLS